MGQTRQNIFGCQLRILRQNLLARQSAEHPTDNLDRPNRQAANARLAMLNLRVSRNNISVIYAWHMA
jgi:hypothetical protein